jgi:hypothetical protein
MTCNPSNNVALGEEIKALLILTLLKSGVHSDEIQLALRIARGQSVFGSEAGDSIFQMVRPAARITPKQVVRNEHLAPIKGYAA